MSPPVGAAGGLRFVFTAPPSIKKFFFFFLPPKRRRRAAKRRSCNSITNKLVLTQRVKAISITWLLVLSLWRKWSLRVNTTPKVHPAHLRLPTRCSLPLHRNPTSCFLSLLPLLLEYNTFIYPTLRKFTLLLQHVV